MEGGGDPPHLVASASCSDRFCQMKVSAMQQCRRSRGFSHSFWHFSLVLAAEAQPCWGGRGLGRGSGRLQGTSVWGIQHLCLVLWLVSGHKIPLRALK